MFNRLHRPIHPSPFRDRNNSYRSFDFFFTVHPARSTHLPRKSTFKLPTLTLWYGWPFSSVTTRLRFLPNSLLSYATVYCFVVLIAFWEFGPRLTSLQPIWLCFLCIHPWLTTSLKSGRFVELDHPLLCILQKGSILFTLGKSGRYGNTKVTFLKEIISYDNWYVGFNTQP